jgi:hypothetical protein
MRDALRPILAPAAACVLLAGCGFFGSGGGHAPAAGHKLPAAAAHKAVNPATAIDPEMVAGVALSKTRGTVDLRFALRQHPQPGQPTQLDVALIPDAGLERVTVTFRAEDGLELRDGSGTTPHEHPEAGVPIGHSLTIVPRSEGIFYVSATVLAETQNDSSVRVFTIPVITGGGVGADDDARPAAAPVARTADSDRARTH